ECQTMIDSDAILHLYKAEVTMTGKGTRFQEWMPVFFTVNILALLMPGYLQKSSITMTERG
ncbi:hypothetical protein ACUAXO_005509, partial [Escherichia coli]